jgi:hypothetical protein
MDEYFHGLSNNGGMDLEGMIDVIESSGKDNAYALVEAEGNAISRFKLRALFFQACYELKEHFDMKNDEWEET